LWIGHERDVSVNKIRTIQELPGPKSFPGFRRSLAPAYYVPIPDIESGKAAIFPIEMPYFLSELSIPLITLVPPSP
jgi:hypothetical protein